MSDDKSMSGSQDGTKIAISEDYEVRAGSHNFRVTEDQLKAAFKVVGDNVAAVEARLKSMRH